MVLRSVNPATGEEVERFAEQKVSEIRMCLDRATVAFGEWRNATFDERGGFLRTTAHLLRRNRRRHGELMALEMGKPIREGTAEAEKCASVCDFYADHAAEFLADEELPTEAKRSFVRCEPLGPILAVMPWNFPFWQVFRFAAPALMAGNVALLKHASNVPRCALTIGETFEEAGLPKGVFQTLLIGSDRIPNLVADPRVRGVTVTGSDKAGAAVAELAGASVKKTVLELGGSDPFIVLGDADLGEAATTAARARSINSGQSCIAAKRFIVERTAYSQFMKGFRAAMERLKVGNPLEDDTEIGPLARGDLRDELHRQVRRSLVKGARVELGGGPLPGAGFYYAPTILSRVGPGMPAYDEELFGPVAAVVRVADEATAIRVANDSKYGLGASVWTQDVARGMKLAEQIESGMVFVNRLVKSDPRLPFGGVKGSGYGRELGAWGIREFVAAKTIVAG